MITAVALWYGTVAAATLAVGGWSAKKSNAGPFVWSSWIVTAIFWPLMMPIALLMEAVDQ